METDPPRPPIPVIPPPNLAPPPPPPLSPLDRMTVVAPRPQVVEAGAAVVNLKSADEAVAGDAGGLAPLNSRLAAGAIDLVTGLGILLALSWILPGFTAHLAGPGFVAYMIARDSLPFLGGQSIGKRAMKLRVVTREGGAITKDWEKAVLRNLTLVIPLMGLIELYFLLVREDGALRGQRLGDEWAKTKVVVAPEVADAEEL